MVRIKVIMPEIASAGYDALCGILELEFSQDGQIWQFYDVPETVWYALRQSKAVQTFFNTNIIGIYKSKRIS